MARDPPLAALPDHALIIPWSLVRIQPGPPTDLGNSVVEREASGEPGDRGAAQQAKSHLRYRIPGEPGVSDSFRIASSSGMSSGTLVVTVAQSVSRLTSS